VVADWPRIETDRLVLRRWDLQADLDAYAAICADPEVMRYIGDGRVATRDETAAKLEQFEQAWDDNGFGLFALERRDTGELIGNTGLAVPDFLPEILPAVEIGWRLARSQWRQGFATEAARAALAFGWEPVGLDRVVSVHVVGNDASGNVMQKLGMHLDRETVHPTNGRAVRVYAIDRPATG
jgi:RimJ/RimL family protein N-acetyltransferase